MTSRDSSFIRTTIQIRRAGSIALGISYDYTNLPGSMPGQKDFQLWTDQAIERWYSLLSPAQKFALPDLQLSLKISGNYPMRET